MSDWLERLCSRCPYRMRTRGISGWQCDYVVKVGRSRFTEPSDCPRVLVCGESRESGRDDADDREAGGDL